MSTQQQRTEHLTSEEIQIYNAFLSNLRLASGDKTTTPDRFQATLRSMNLNFGTPVVDKLLLLCTITSSVVSLERLLEILPAASSSSTTSSSTAPASPSLPSPSPRSVVADTRGLAQAERVHKMTDKIQALFRELESGNASMDTFRAELAKLGIQETHEARRILRQTPISFRKLIHALTQTQSEIAYRPRSTPDAYLSTNINLFGHYDGEKFTHIGRGNHVFAERAMHDSDVVTWQKRPPKRDPRGRKAPGQYHQNVAESHFAIRMDGKALPPLYSSDVAEMMRETDDHHFETTTQKTLTEGVTPGTGKIPITSAGYHTADRGLLREQIYACIRNLDHETVTAEEFRQRMRKILGENLPAAAARQLHKFEREGRIDFNRFARSFEDYLDKQTTHVPLPPPSSSAAATAAAGKNNRSRTPSVIRHHKGHYVNAVAAGNHGDIITWNGTRSNEAVPRHHDPKSFGKKLHNLEESKRENILEWRGEYNPSEHHRRHVDSPAAKQNHPEMLRWRSGTKHEDTSIFHTSTRLGRECHIARQHKSHPCPYGTVRDESAPNLDGIQQVVGSRKRANVGPRSHPTGTWFNPDAAPKGTHFQKRFLPSAAGLHRDHLGVGMNIPKEDVRSGKKNFAAQKAGKDHLVGGAANERASSSS